MSTLAPADYLATPSVSGCFETSGVVEHPSEGEAGVIDQMTMPTLIERANDGAVGVPPAAERPRRRGSDSQYEEDKRRGKGYKGEFDEQ